MSLNKRFQKGAFLGKARTDKRYGRHGFTLLETIVSLAILAISLSSLLSSNATSIDVIGRSRDLTVGTLLAQSKLIDIEQYLIDEKFKQGTEFLKGDFKDEGWPDYKWVAEVRELETDLLNFTQGLDGLLPEAASMDSEAKDLMEDSMEGILGMLGPMVDPFLDEISNSVRLIYLTISWPRGRYSQSISFSRLVTTRDYSIALTDDSADSNANNANSNGSQNNNNGKKQNNNGGARVK